jgi:hypothetical protein
VGCEVIVAKGVSLELNARASYRLVIRATNEGDKEVCGGLYE